MQRARYAAVQTLSTGVRNIYVIFDSLFPIQETGIVGWLTDDSQQLL